MFMGFFPSVAKFLKKAGGIITGEIKFYGDGSTTEGGNTITPELRFENDTYGNQLALYQRGNYGLITLQTGDALDRSKTILQLSTLGCYFGRIGSIHFSPWNNDNNDLGESTKRWKTIYGMDLNIDGFTERKALSSDPGNPPANSHRIWQSDGTGSGADGDIMMKITDSGGTTKTVTLVDFSTA